MDHNLVTFCSHQEIWKIIGFDPFPSLHVCCSNPNYCGLNPIFGGSNCLEKPIFSCWFNPNLWTQRWIAPAVSPTTCGSSSVPLPPRCQPAIPHAKSVGKWSPQPGADPISGWSSFTTSWADLRPPACSFSGMPRPGVIERDCGRLVTVSGPQFRWKPSNRLVDDFMQRPWVSDSICIKTDDPTNIWSTKFWS
jgi:hypothetical protein